MINIPHLETDITVACQLSCVACNHMVVPWRSSGNVWRADPDQVRKDLNTLVKFVHADRWGALGGEPLLHPALHEIIQIVKLSGICNQIEIWTNGIQLTRGLNDLFWHSPFDILVLSRYEGKLSDDDIESIQISCLLYNKGLEIKDERVWHNFRTNLEPSPTNPERTKYKFDHCFFRQFSRVANNGYFYTCCCAPHQPRLLQDKPEGTDGIAIDDNLTEESLLAYLNRSEPLGCCSICAGRDTAQPINWHEERNLDSWLQASKGM